MKVGGAQGHPWMQLWYALIALICAHGRRSYASQHRTNPQHNKSIRLTWSSYLLSFQLKSFSQAQSNEPKLPPQDSSTCMSAKDDQISHVSRQAW